MKQTYGDGHGNANEEHICAKANGHKTLVLTKLMIESVGDGTSQAKWESHTRSSNTERYPPILYEKPQIHLESYQEEEEDQTNVSRR